MSRPSRDGWLPIARRVVREAADRAALPGHLPKFQIAAPIGKKDDPVEEVLVEEFLNNAQYEFQKSRRFGEISHTAISFGVTLEHS